MIMMVVVLMILSYVGNRNRKIKMVKNWQVRLQEHVIMRRRQCADADTDSEDEDEQGGFVDHRKNLNHYLEESWTKAVRPLTFLGLTYLSIFDFDQYTITSYYKYYSVYLLNLNLNG